ncbi:hypothetical protein D3C80_1491130 [compost metagenome]
MAKGAGLEAQTLGRLIKAKMQAGCIDSGRGQETHTQGRLADTGRPHHQGHRRVGQPTAQQLIEYLHTTADSAKHIAAQAARVAVERFQPGVDLQAVIRDLAFMQT